MEEERKKLLEDEGKYREKFEKCKADTARYEAIIKRVLSNDIEELRDYLMSRLQIPTQKTDFLNKLLHWFRRLRLCSSCQFTPFRN